MKFILKHEHQSENWKKIFIDELSSLFHIIMSENIHTHTHGVINSLVCVKLQHIYPVQSQRICLNAHEIATTKKCIAVYCHCNFSCNLY